MKSFIHSKAWPAAVGTLLIIVAAGCGRDGVKVYHVSDADTANPAPLPAAAPAAMPATMPDNSGQPSLQYILPAGWNKKALSPMRVASFGISDGGRQADVSVIPLGGPAGNDPANVNRWRGQIGLPPLADTELAQLAEKVEVAGQPADLYDIAGTSPGSGDAERIIGAILHSDNVSWFFKMSGDSALVETNKAAFITFLKSVQFGDMSAPSTMDLSQLPPSHPPPAGMSPGAQNFLFSNANTNVAGGLISDNSGKPAWIVPAGWQEGQPAQFLVAKYIITGTGGVQAAVNVSLLAGDGGGLAANVNRWRGTTRFTAIYRS